MSKLFIANAKTQVEAFTYRVPDDGDDPRRASAPRVQMIQPGSQVEVSGDLSTAQIDAIVDQHRMYGLIEVSQIDRNKTFAGLVYSVDKPVSPARLAQLMGRNVDVLRDRGQEMRRLAAVTISNQLEDDLREQGMPGELNKLETEVVEITDGRRDRGSEVPVSERVRVSRAAETPAPPRQSRKRAAA